MLHIIQNCVLFLTALSSFFVISVSNPVLSLLWLILSFGFSSIIFMIFGIEFLSLLIFMVYIGAIAVLFLFVIMMLNIKIVEISSTYLRYLPVSFFIIVFFLFELALSMHLKFNNNFFNEYIDWIFFFDYLGNLSLFGLFFYTFFNYFLILIAFILFISMLGSIVLVVNWNEQPLNNKMIYSNLFYYKKRVTFVRNKRKKRWFWM